MLKHQTNVSRRFYHIIESRQLSSAIKCLFNLSRNRKILKSSSVKDIILHSSTKHSMQLHLRAFHLSVDDSSSDGKSLRSLSYRSRNKERRKHESFSKWHECYIKSASCMLRHSSFG